MADHVPPFFTSHSYHMYSPAVAAASAVTAALLYRIVPRPSPCPVPPRTLLDAASVDGVVTLVKRLSHPDRNADELSRRLERLYTRFPPREHALRRLSLFQQSHVGRHDEREYCIVLVYVIAMLCVPASHPLQRHASSCSAPPSPVSRSPLCARRSRRRTHHPTTRSAPGHRFSTQQ